MAGPALLLGGEDLKQTKQKQNKTNPLYFPKPKNLKVGVILFNFSPKVEHPSCSRVNVFGFKTHSLGFTLFIQSTPSDSSNKIPSLAKNPTRQVYLCVESSSTESPSKFPFSNSVTVNQQPICIPGHLRHCAGYRNKHESQILPPISNNPVRIPSVTKYLWTHLFCSFCLFVLALRGLIVFIFFHSFYSLNPFAKHQLYH